MARPQFDGTEAPFFMQVVLKAVHKYYENNRDKVLDYKKNYYQTVIKPRKEAAKALLQLAEQTVEESPIPEKIEV